MCKRLAIYFSNDSQSITRSCTIRYLESLKSCLSKLLVATKAPVSSEAKKILDRIGCDLHLVADDVLSPSRGWMSAFASLDLKLLEQYDDLVLCDDSCYGPFQSSFQKMFTQMEQKQQLEGFDFWGIAKQRITFKGMGFLGMQKKTFDLLQLNFLVFSKKVFLSQCFNDWWDSLTKLHQKSKHSQNHEFLLSYHLEEHGFKSSTLVNVEKYASYSEGSNIQFINALDLIKEEHLPLIVKEVFYAYTYFFQRGLANISRHVIDYITSEDSEFADEIWADLLARVSMSCLKESLALNFILPDEKCDLAVDSKTLVLSSKSIGLICFVYYEDLIDDTISYIFNLPAQSFVYLVSSKQTLLDSYKEKLLKINHGLYIEYRLKENRGRDLAAYLVTCRDVYAKHDYICCVHDKKSSHLRYALSSKDFSYHCFDNCLHSQIYVENIIKTFERNPRLGLLVPPTIYFGDFVALGDELGSCNEVEYKKLYNKFGISVPYELEPVASFGSMFWVRAKAMNTLLSNQWKNEDFPGEPMALDGTINHALERFFPIAVQNDGFYTAWSMPYSFAVFYLNNLSFGLKKINKRVYKICGKLGALDLDKKLSVLKPQFPVVKILKYTLLVPLSLGLVKKWRQRLSRLWRNRI